MKINAQPKEQLPNGMEPNVVVQMQPKLLEEQIQILLVQLALLTQQKLLLTLVLVNQVINLIGLLVRLNHVEY